MLQRTRYNNISFHNANHTVLNAFLKRNEEQHVRKADAGSRREKVFSVLSPEQPPDSLPPAAPGCGLAGAALTAFLTQEKRSTDLNAAAAELLQLSSRKRGQHGFKCQRTTLELLQPEAAGAETPTETPTSPPPLEPETSKNACEASSRLRFRTDFFQQGAAHPRGASAAAAGPVSGRATREAPSPGQG